MGEVSVDQAVNLISSGRLKDRIDGLEGDTPACRTVSIDSLTLCEDLKHILLQNRRSPRLYVKISPAAGVL